MHCYHQTEEDQSSISASMMTNMLSVVDLSLSLIHGSESFTALQEGL